MVLYAMLLSEVRLNWIKRVMIHGNDIGTCLSSEFFSLVQVGMLKGQQVHYEIEIQYDVTSGNFKCFQHLHFSFKNVCLRILHI